MEAALGGLTSLAARCSESGTRCLPRYTFTSQWHNFRFTLCTLDTDVKIYSFKSDVT